ncbi:serine hydrolase domain-containing protein [Microbaculum marinum]|uniref:Serine hydrolase n=1 Tax=Microbaculum marinum TaxID=1764581 RepID=A0AAW9RP11_9HYPH
MRQILFVLSVLSAALTGLAVHTGPGRAQEPPPASAPPASAPSTTAPLADRLAPVLEAAEALRPLQTVVVAVDGGIVAERGYRGHSTTASTNIKSASKSIVSALVGIAIDKGILEGADQPIAPILEADLPDDPDPRIHDITIGNLLSMQAGLERTSGANYGGWIASPNWVRDALARPFVDDPGGGMLYSTGSTHLLSAILTKASGRPTLELARDWLGPLEGFHIGSWERDPQGIYLGGNQMAMTPRSLVAFGELYRRGGVTPATETSGGERLVSEDWIAQSWTPRTASVFSGDDYGYAWFMRDIAGHPVRFAWGYGGQMLYVVPSLDLTVAMTSSQEESSARSGHRDDLHALLAQIIGVVEGENGAGEEDEDGGAG